MSIGTLVENSIEKQKSIRKTDVCEFIEESWTCWDEIVDLMIIFILHFTFLRGEELRADVLSTACFATCIFISRWKPKRLILFWRIETSRRIYHNIITVSSHRTGQESVA